MHMQDSKFHFKHIPITIFFHTLLNNLQDTYHYLVSATFSQCIKSILHVLSFLTNRLLSSHVEPVQTSFNPRALI